MDLHHITKEYSNSEVTVLWQSHLCIHAAKCAIGLPQVFNPRARPWIHLEGASAAQITEQVKQCPSGALSLVNSPKPI